MTVFETQLCGDISINTMKELRFNILPEGGGWNLTYGAHSIENVYLKICNCSVSSEKQFSIIMGSPQ